MISKLDSTVFKAMRVSSHLVSLLSSVPWAKRTMTFGFALSEWFALFVIDAIEISASK